MPRRQIQVINQEFYHIVKRGFEEKEIFLDEEDHLRFVNSLLIFNDKNYSPWNFRFFWRQKSPENLVFEYSTKTPLVEIHAFALMPNHFHLLLRQLIDNGISLFIQKLGGYSQYFNKKYQREGALFPNRYKIVHIKTEEQLKNTFVYVHTNSVALIEPKWKDWEVRDFSKVVDFLENKYRWSSYKDYLGKENFPRVINCQFFRKLFGGEKEIQKEVRGWVKFKSLNFKNDKNLSQFFIE